MSPIHQLVFVLYFKDQILVSHYRKGAGIFARKICTNSRTAIIPGATQDKLVRWPPQQFVSATFSRQLALDATFCSDTFFAHLPTWSQVPGYANGGYKGLQRPPGRAVPVANHHQPNNCPACLAAQEVPTAFSTTMVRWVLMGTSGTCGYLWASSTVVFWAPLLSPGSPWSPWLWSSWSPSSSSSPTRAPHCFCSAG